MLSAASATLLRNSWTVVSEQRLKSLKGATAPGVEMSLDAAR